MKKIIITGPESSGKTTIAMALSKALNAAWVPEYSRQYLTEKASKYHFDDLRKIAQGQLEMEQKFSSFAKEYIILDTSMLVLKVWSEEKYRKADPYILRRLNLEKPSIYLLCKPDMPWEQDPLRESENQREILFERYLEYLKVNNCIYEILDGSKKNRLAKALDFIKSASLE